jgi:hypothetical protein
LDIHENVLLAGSNRGKEPLQIFDIGTRKMITNVDWEVTGGFSDTAFLYSARFLKGSTDVIFAGGAAGMFKIFEEQDLGVQGAQITQ